MSGEDATFVIVQQQGNDAVSGLIQDFISRRENSFLLITNGSAKYVSANISFNRIAGYRFCFDKLGCEYVVALEDDVVISQDFFYFARFIMNKFYNDTHFRGVNFGSHEKYSSASVVNYQKIRFGIQGPASAITRRSWKKINTRHTLKNLRQTYTMEPLNII